MKRSIKVFALLILIISLLGILSGCNRLMSIFGSDDTTSIELCQISLEQDTYQYTGEEIKPKVSIKYNSKLLEENKDYTLSYSDNIAVGKGKITISGIGNYSGQKTVEFEIAEKVYTYIFKCNYPSHYEMNGKSVQQVTDKSQLVPPIVQAKGYSFVKWYALPNTLIDFSDLDSVPSTGGEIWALVAPNNYAINYHLDGGKNNPLNPDTYNYESDFALLEPEKDGEEFAGWYLDENFTQRIERISPCNTGNIDIYAKFISSDYRQITYVMPEDAEYVHTEHAMPGSIIKKPEVLSDDKTKELVWYQDSACTIKYVFRTMPDNDITIYAQWEDVLDAGFLDSLPDGSIDSYEELVEYVEYVCFYNVLEEDSMPVNVTYISGATKINSEITKAAQECTYPRIGSLSFSSTTNTTTIYQTEDLVYKEATLSGTPQSEWYKQYGSVLYEPAGTRSEDYDDFAINYVEDTYPCTTSNQLFYILSHGYRPLPQQGSQAELVYNEYKAIMRDMVDDGMSDHEKVKTIYEWLILNVYYDNYVANNGDGLHDLFEYKAFHLEGVLEGSAVCDGISKAFSVMCAIEGIDSVRVTGQIPNAQVGHAWNKIQISGKWYLSDATWGNQTFGGTEEYLVYEYMLFTDEERLMDGYVSNNYTYYDTIDDYKDVNVYDDIVVEVGGNFADMLIDDAEELSYVLEYIYFENGSQESGKILNVMITQNMQFSTVLNDAYILLMQRRPSSITYRKPSISYYDGTSTNNEFSAGTKFLLLFS